MNRTRKTSLFSFLILTLFYLIIRYPLFALHGMKQWPLVLYLIGIVLTVVPGLLAGRHTLPVIACLSYVSGFFAAYLTQSDYGEGLNNLWIIWTFVFLGASLAGVVLDIAAARVSRRS